MMTPWAWLTGMVALLALVRVRTTLSGPSSWLSAMIGTRMVLEYSSGAKVRVPLVGT